MDKLFNIAGVGMLLINRSAKFLPRSAAISTAPLLASLLNRLVMVAADVDLTT